MAYLEHDPRTGQYVQRCEVRTCRGCQARLALPHFRPVYHACITHGDHWELICKDCGTSNWDTVCDMPSQAPLEGHRRG